MNERFEQRYLAARRKYIAAQFQNLNNIDTDCKIMYNKSSLINQENGRSLMAPQKPTGILDEKFFETLEKYRKISAMTTDVGFKFYAPKFLEV